MLMGSAKRKMRHHKRKRKSAIRRKRRIREVPIQSLKSASMTSHEMILSS